MTKYHRWIPSLVIMLVIFVSSSIPGQTINAIGLGKEAYHVNGHFILFLILCFANYKATKNILVSILFTILYAFADEFHQTLTPFRSASFFDIYIDTFAAFIAGVILWKLQHILPKKLVTWLIN